jgi:MFS family permease
MSRRPKPNPLRRADDDKPSSAADAAPLHVERSQQQQEEHGCGNGAGGPRLHDPPLVSGAHGSASTLGTCCAAIGGASFALLNLCSFFKGVDDSVLPAVFLEVGATLGVGPQSLGTLGMIGAFTIGLAAPPAGWLGTRYSRPRLISYGCFIWSIGAVGMGACSSYWMLALSRGVNGIGLGIIGPLMYGMVVDSWEPHQRGKALGVLGITGSIGGLSGGWFATTIGSTTILGFAGWRFPLYVCAITGALIGVLVNVCVSDPAKTPGGSSTTQEEGIWETLTVRPRLTTANTMQLLTFVVVIGLRYDRRFGKRLESACGSLHSG